MRTSEGVTMNKMKLIVSGIVIATSMVAVSGTVSAAAPVMECTIDPMPLNKWEKSFTKSTSNVAATFTLKGDANCKKAMTIAVWNSPTGDGTTVNEQKLYSSKTGVFGKGEHTISTKLNGDCYYQADLLKGNKATAPDGTANYAFQNGVVLKDHQLQDFTFGGKKKCEDKVVTPKPPVVKPPVTPTPETPVKPTPETPVAPAPVTPVATTPEEQKSAPVEALPSTGAGSIIAGTMGLSSTAGFAYNYAQSRRKKRMM